MRIFVVALAVVAGLLAVRWNRKLAWLVAVVWVAVLVYVAFMIRAPYAVPRIVFEPFHALKLFLKDMNTAPSRGLGFLEGAVLNLLIFVPVGYLVPVLWNRVNRLWEVLLLGFCLSLGVELLQLVTLRGMFDLDDLMNNTIGAAVGWVCYRQWFS